MIVGRSAEPVYVVVGGRRQRVSARAVAVPMATEFLEEEEQLVLLTHEQSALLSRFGRERRMVVTGCAGSGKTMLAVERAKRLAAKGEEVLFVCFNRALLEHLRRSESQARISFFELVERTDKVGIDAPFGWPEEFVSFVAGHHRMEPWPGADAADPDSFRSLLSFRETDRRVRSVRRPLSVSTDKIGVTAMRCAALLHAIGEVDRAGLGKVVEVYPAAALARWGQQSGGYKKHAADALPPMLRGVRDILPGLELGEFRPELERSDHAFDALICSLVARAAAMDLTDGPERAVLARARREGWIHLPRPNSLASLATPD